MPKLKESLKNLPLSEKEIWSVEEAAAVCNMSQNHFRSEILPQAAARDWVTMKGSVTQIRSEPFRRWIRKQTHI